MPSLMDTFLGIAQIIGGIYTISNGAKRGREQFVRDVGNLGNIGGDKLKATLHNVYNIDQRIKKIVSMINKGKIHPKIRETSVKIVSKFCGNKYCVAERDYYNEAKSVFNWVRKYIRYVHDIRGIDTFQHPIRTIEFGGGDCDDYTILLASLYLSLGYPVKLKVVNTIKNNDYDHIYLLVGIPPVGKNQSWISVDASVNKPFGWEVPGNYVKKHKIYDISNK